MARKGSHQKNGVVDHNQTKPKKKTPESLPSRKGQGKASEAESVLKQSCQDDDKHTRSSETSERDMASVKDVDNPVASETDLAGDDCNATTTQETRHTRFDRERINALMRTLLDILSTNSPSENIGLAYNAAIRKLRIPAATVSREVNQWMERNRPLIVSVKSRVYKARDVVTKKIRLACPVVFRWLMHFGSILLLLSLVWLDCAIRGFDSFIRMGTASFFSIMWCGVFSAFSMIGVTKFILMSFATVLVSLFIGFVVGSITLAISSLVFLWLYGSFWTTLMFLFLGGLAFMTKHERIALFILTVYSVYSALGYVGWLGLLLAFNLAFISTDALIYFFNNKINQQSTDGGPSDPLNGSSFENGPGFPGDRGPGVPSTSGTDSELTSEGEVARLLNCADKMGIPRKLIDLRHEGSHRELPSLLVLRDASYEALEWLKSFYWVPQKAQIPLKRDGTASIRREVKSKLRKLSFCFQLKQNPQYDSPLVKEKCSNKRTRKIVSSLVELYPSFSAEISSVLLEFLLKALDSSKSAELENQSGQDIRVFLDVWKPVIMVLSNREPELLLTLLKSVIDMIQNNEQRRYETDVNLTDKSAEEVSQAGQLPVLFAWLVGLLTVSKHFQRNSSVEVTPPSTFLMELIRKCLLLGALGHELVLKSGCVLGDIVGGRVLKEKLKSLPLVDKSSTSVPSKQTSPTMLLEQQEKNLRSAGKRLESVKLQLSRKKGNETEKANKRWKKATTWSTCPIGMLPRIIGSSGRLPLLDNQDAHMISKQAQGNNNAKRVAECSTQELENSAFKRARKSTEDHNSNEATLEAPEEEAEMDKEQTDEETESESEGNLMLEDEEEGIGYLRIGDVWKRVKDGEQLVMASQVKICV